MNTKIMCASVLALSVTLGSCGTTGKNGWDTATTTATIIATDIDKFVRAVDARAIALCKFLPGPGVVEQLISTASPSLGTVEAVAQAICAALKAFPLSSRRLGGRLGGDAPTVNGVVIHGTFVR